MISIHRYHDTDGLESRLIYSTVVVSFQEGAGCTGAYDAEVFFDPSTNL